MNCFQPKLFLFLSTWQIKELFILSKLYKKEKKCYNQVAKKILERLKI